MFLFVAYDVPAKRTEKYRKLLSRYLPQLQNSVFAGDITEKANGKMNLDIKALYEESDHLIFIKTANRRNIHVEIMKGGGSQTDTSHLGSTIA